MTLLIGMKISDICKDEIL